MNTTTAIAAPTNMATTRPPARLRMTYEEFLQWSDEDMHAEWVNGEVIVHMPPKPIHQITVAFLHRLLGLFVDLFGLGQVYIAPFEVVIRPGYSSREPDLFFVTRERRHLVDEDRLTGPADLIIEIISKDSVQRDRDDKFSEYREAGVREYWILDPRPQKQRADFYRLTEAGKYELFATEDDEWVSSYALPGFRLKPEWLWQADRLNPLTCSLEIQGVAEAILQEIQRAQGRDPTVDKG